MKKSIDVIIWLIEASRQAYSRKWSFLWVFAVAVLGNISMLATLDLLPEARQTILASNVLLKTNTLIAEHASASPVVPELPTKIEIPAIELSVAILNPTATSIAVLDEALLRGVVRYPTSAQLGEQGNVVVFGHSSYLPVVNNKAYKAFNGIQKLVAGDVITVYSATSAHTYRVRIVENKSATDAMIPLAVSGRVLTLSTCDSFGSKADRFVVTADFVESHSISI